MTRLPAIEAVRGLAALAIVLYHVHGSTDHDPGRVLGALLDRGYLGVPLFFVLSGFLLYRPYARATLHGTAWPSLRRYVRARALRIVPAYWLALTGVIVLRAPGALPAAVPALAGIGWLLMRSLRAGRAVDSRRLRAAKSVGSVVVAGTLLVAIALIPSITFDRWWDTTKNYLFLHLNFDGETLIGPSWTLCIEVSFYLALPLLALAIARIARGGATSTTRMARTAPVFAAMIGGAVIWQSVAPDAREWNLLPGFLDQFAVGMLLALAHEQRGEWRLQRPAVRVLAVTTAAVAVVAGLVEHTGPTVQPWLGGAGESVFYRPLMAASFALALACLLGARRSVVRRVLMARPAAAAGLVSYGVFLWHAPLLAELREHGAAGGAVPFSIGLGIVLAVTFACAALSWRLVEAPALALKDDGRARRLRSRALTGLGPQPALTPATSATTTPAG